MKKAVAATQEEFGHIRTGRASPHLLDRIHIDYYGAPTPLNQIAGISVPEARMMVISPYDKSSLSAIEKAIQQSDLGVNPNNDGSIIRLNFPPLTEDRRKVLIKQVKERAEDGKIAVRNVRRHVKDEMEKMKKDGDISEDELKRSEKELQKLTDHYVEEIDTMFSHKEKELLEV
ncbi:MAG TPA: ribosome recycling factor [Actinomycetota bacterium]|nr:ribosome recycling factor [Actinomycetota bacterium]